MSEAAALSRVIGDIYDAAIDAALWPQALRSACGFVGANNTRLYWHGPSDEVKTLYDYNCDSNFTQLYVERYAPLNPCYPALFFRDVGSMTAASDILPRHELHETRFYREWLAPQGQVDSLCTVLEKEPMRGAFVSMEWLSEIGVDAREHMALLVPHLQRAVAIGRLFVRHRTTEKALTDTLNHFDAAVFLVAGKGNITFANVAGLTMIKEGALLHKQGTALEAADHVADRALKDSLRAIAKGNVATGIHGTTVVLSDSQDHRWIANVLPLVDGARRLTGETHDAIAAVFVRNSVFSIPTDLEALSRLYDFTASEVRVVDAIMKVSGIKAIAEILGISDATVKTHLNRIYRKSGAKNQGELIKLIAGIGR